MKFFLKSAAFAIFMGIFMFFSSCSNESNGYGEQILSWYSQSSDYRDSITSVTYHVVAELQCVDNGNYTFTVTKEIFHYFSTANAFYKNLSYNELTDLIKKGRTIPSTTVKTYTSSGAEPLEMAFFTFYRPAKTKVELRYYE